MAQNIQMKVVADLKFPAGVFSPLAASSPKLTRMRAPIRDQSWTSSSDESIGNVTSQAVTGIDESHLNEPKTNMSSASFTSVHTALEYVDPTAFHSNKVCTEMITREELQAAIVDRRVEETGCPKGDAELYATVVTERILWNSCRTWYGTIPVASKDNLSNYVDYACDDWYMRNTGLLCVEELHHLSNFEGRYDSKAVSVYCYEKGTPIEIVDRIFSKNLVRKTEGDCLSAIEMCWLLFAMVGTDEMQSIEYWFRILDVHSNGVLSFTDLEEIYGSIVKYLAKHEVTSLPFDHVMSQFVDILGTEEWTLRSFKKSGKLIYRVINGFTNALRFLEQEMNEKMNGERIDDESFGQGTRTRWQRMIDHEYDAYYRRNDSSSSPESSYSQ